MTNSEGTARKGKSVVTTRRVVGAGGEVLTQDSAAQETAGKPKAVVRAVVKPEGQVAAQDTPQAALQETAGKSKSVVRVVSKAEGQLASRVPIVRNVKAASRGKTLPDKCAQFYSSWCNT